MDSIIMGIDPSINCTGVCVGLPQKYIYILIPGKMTKKMSQFHHADVHIKCYNKLDTKELAYEDKELTKSTNIHNICNIIESLIKEYGVTHVNMEGISYGSVGSAALADLSGLNFVIRETLIRNGVSFSIIPPTGLKKFAVANGSADKDLMIYAWQTLQPHLKDIKDIKIDDLADAFFLSNYKNTP